MLTVIVNGEKRQFEEGTSVASMLASLGIVSRRMAVERNKEILPKTGFEDAMLTEGDVFEIIEFVGGGF